MLYTHSLGLLNFNVMSTTENLTHWKKNNDSKYISGEDLHSGLRGLEPEMAVVIDRFEDAETFDQNNQQKLIRTGFWLKKLDGSEIYKPVILNNTNAKFCVKEFASEYMEHWVGKPLILFAMPDKRFGFVARFKKYYAPVVVDEKAAFEKLSKSTTLAELKTNFLALGANEQNNSAVIGEKDRLKSLLK